ncbi:Podocalyxin [Tupaia chinensis]|uniref:Podocalyxin n=1 Tax=Tupaia chinensis TaxID=246437 RepID=L9JBV6_TUPCH|nr:Podocalyxin [Tupaia chinensis]
MHAALALGEILPTCNASTRPALLTQTHGACERPLGGPQAPGIKRATTAGQPDPASSPSPTPGQPDAAPVPVHTVGTPSPGKQGLAPEHTTVSSGSGPNVTGNQNSDNQGNLSVTPTTKGGGPVTPATADIVGTTNSATLRMPAGGSLKPPENSSKEQQGLPPQGAPTTLSPALGTVATPPVEGPTGVSSKPASTDLQDSTTTSSTWTLGNKRITCEPPERLTEKLLVLNLTRASLCAGSPPDDKLVTILCRSAKATYDLAQDHCHVLLAPISESRAVAVKEITIQTNLLPKDVFELLKDKWDDLQEVGVSDMQLGDQGPPEEAEDRFSMPLIITIVCMACCAPLGLLPPAPLPEEGPGESFVLEQGGQSRSRDDSNFIIAKRNQRLTEELQTVENGYHDNPTLEVMETSSEMQEKKVVSLNGELGDSWIVPLDNLTKDDLDEEEDTHL